MPRWIFLFLLSAAITAVTAVSGLEWFLRARVVPFDGNVAHFEFFRSATAPSAIFGNSRAAYGFQGGTQVVNLAHPGDPLRVVAWKVQKYFERVQPDLVIVQLDSLMFSTPGRMPDSAVAELTSYYEYGGRLYVLHPYYRPRLVSFLKYFLRGGRQEDNLLNDPLTGFRPIRGTVARWSEERRRTDAKLTATNYAPTGAPAAAADTELRGLVEWLQAKGAKVCLALFPVTADLREAEASIPAYAEFHSRLANLAAAYRVPLADLESAVDDEALFFDLSHLNADGAVRMAPVLLERCRAGV